MSRLRASLAALALVAGVGIAVGTAAPASAATICEQYGSVVAGSYIIQNNRWGTSATQCIDTTSNGFTITQSGANNATNGAPAAYPSIIYGVHYTLRTPGTILPLAVSNSAFNGINTSVSMSYPSSGTWDAAYDIWFDPTPRTDGQNTGAELMVWLNHQGSIQPVGSRVATVSLAGSTWDVWFGNSGWNVVSYVRTSGTGSISFPVATFFNDMVTRGYGQRSWYLTSIQAGFEPWVGGVGLAVNSFSVTTGNTPVTTSTTTTTTRPTTTTTTTTTRPTTTTTATTTRPTTTTTPTTTTPTTTTTTSRPVTTTTSGGGARSCSAAFKVIGSWQGGFQGEVTVTAGSSAISGWTATWTAPTGQTISQSWNATLTTSGSSVTAKNLSYNGSLGASASAAFGFIGAGPATVPAVSCTAA